MCELDENKFLLNIIKFNKNFKLVYTSYTKLTYDTISAFIKDLLCNF